MTTFNNTRKSSAYGNLVRPVLVAAALVASATVLHAATNDPVATPNQSKTAMPDKVLAPENIDKMEKTDNRMDKTDRMGKTDRMDKNDKMNGTENSSEHAVSDSWITTKVKAEILANSVSKGFKVGVTTKNGVVSLKGKLPTQDAADLVKTIAEKVKGVQSVDVSGLAV